ncbi:hypothetical protein [Clostridium sp. 2218st1_F5_2218SCRN_220325]|mgnify:CR=1 FL=1|uniref:hypothetical protein n=1 Tax=Clostridium sp. 2218st1_F5_2218SCRN_220325 TaxID=3143056 RepID=UPI00319E0003
MLYILSPVCVIIADNFGKEDVGIVLMFVFIAAATGIIIYSNMVNTKYKKQEDTIVEDFKEWQSTKSRNYKAYKSIKSVITAITVTIYLLVSFLTFQWWITWIIFLIGGAVQRAVKAYFEIKEM